MTPRVSVSVFGGLAVKDRADRLVALPTRKAAALLAFLALHPGRCFTRSHLSALLWGDQSEVRARQSLRQALSAIRLALGPAVIDCDAQHVRSLHNAIICDANDFRTMVDARTLDAAEKAQALYSGEVLEGHEFGQPLFDDWLSTEREKLREIARRNLEYVLVNRSDDADLSQAVATANALLALDPFDEAACRTLMRLYVRQGRLPRALRLFQHLSHALKNEFGVLPEEETRALYDELVQRRAVPSILDSLDEYAFVLEQLVCCVIVTDLESRIIGWNRFAEAEFGFSKDFMIGQKPTYIYAPKRDQALSDRLLGMACEHGHWSSRVKLLSKDGRECYQTRTIAPLYDRSGRLIGGFGTGISSPTSAICPPGFI